MAVSPTTAHDPVPNRPSPSGQRPIRTCIGCRRRASAAELLRVVASGRSVVPDPRHRAAGRGAWVHLEPGCVELAERRRAFGRALRVPVPLDPAPVRDYVTSAAGTTVPAAPAVPATPVVPATQHDPTSGRPQE